MPPKKHPIFDPQERAPKAGPFSREEVRRANRNSGALLESLRHELTPVGLPYLINHFDVPFVPAAED